MSEWVVEFEYDGSEVALNVMANGQGIALHAHATCNIPEREVYDAEGCVSMRMTPEEARAFAAALLQAAEAMQAQEVG